MTVSVGNTRTTPRLQVQEILLQNVQRRNTSNSVRSVHQEAVKEKNSAKLSGRKQEVARQSAPWRPGVPSEGSRPKFHQKRGSLSWLIALPLKEPGFWLKKHDFTDALALRYDKGALKKTCTNSHKNTFCGCWCKFFQRPLVWPATAKHTFQFHVHLWCRFFSWSCNDLLIWRIPYDSSQWVEGLCRNSKCRTRSLPWYKDLISILTYMFTCLLHNVCNCEVTGFFNLNKKLILLLINASTLMFVQAWVASSATGDLRNKCTLFFVSVICGRYSGGYKDYFTNRWFPLDLEQENGACTHTSSFTPFCHPVQSFCP